MKRSLKLKNKIRFVDLPRQNQIIAPKVMPVIQTIIEDADFTMGKRVEKFEKEFASYCNKRYAVSLNSGTDALYLALKAYGIGSNDEVITVPNSYFSTAMVISNLGAKPVFVDIDPKTYTIHVPGIEDRITKKTRAIVPVHMYGQPADMQPIMQLAKKHNLYVVEDACQAHGAKWMGKIVPYGPTGAFSFFPGKNIGAFGEAGAIVTDDQEIYERVQYLRNDGSKEKYIHEMLGVKSRMDALQASVLSIKLPYLNQWNELRRQKADLYNNLLKDIKQITVPHISSYAESSFHLYVIRCENRDGLQNYLTRCGIETIIHYPIPIHLQKAYKKEGFKRGQFPVTEKYSKQILSLPIFPELEVDEIQYICECIRAFYSKN